MLLHRKFLQQVCCQMNPVSSHVNLCINSYSTFAINHILSSWNHKYYQSVSVANCHRNYNTQSHPFKKLLIDLQTCINKNNKLTSTRKYSSCEISKLENEFSKHCPLSQTCCKTIASAAPLSAASIIVPTVVAENHAPTLHDHVATTTTAATNAAATADAYGWLAGYVNFLESVASSAPVMQLMSLLRLAHECTGTPWWLTIVLTTVVVRTGITLPLAFYQQYVAARLELLRGEMVELMKPLAAETKRAKMEYNWDEDTARKHFRRQSRDTWRRLVVRDNCHPGKGVVLVMAQLPLWVLLSISHRNLAFARPVPDAAAVTAYQQLSAEGLLWCPNLTLSDPTLMLPIAMGLVNLIITEVNVLQRPPATTRSMKGMTYFLRGVAVITVPIAMVMPSGVVLYWVTSSCCALVQTLLLLHPGLRRVSGIPLTPSSHPHPYSRLATTLSERLSRKPAVAELPVKTDQVNTTSKNATPRPKKR